MDVDTWGPGAVTSVKCRLKTVCSISLSLTTAHARGRHLIGLEPPALHCSCLPGSQEERGITDRLDLKHCYGPTWVAGAPGSPFNHLESRLFQGTDATCVCLAFVCPWIQVPAGSQKVWGTANNLNLNKELKSLKDRIHAEAREWEGKKRGKEIHLLEEIEKYTEIWVGVILDLYFPWSVNTYLHFTPNLMIYRK